jgi:acetyl esterase/lipase
MTAARLVSRTDDCRSACSRHALARGWRSARFWRAAVLAIVAAVHVHAAAPERVAAVPPVEPVVYKRVGGRELKLFVHRPAGWSASDHRPAILMIHGGGWVGGGVSVFEQQAKHFAQRGLLCAVMEYRLLSKENFDPPLICIQDAKSAMRWLRARAGELGIDPRRIAAMGASAGGHLAAFLGMMDGGDDPADDARISARAQAAILLNPVVHNGPGEWGYGYKRTRDQFRAYSPFHNVTATAAPTIIFQGTKDKLIPIPMIEAFAAELHVAGVRCDVHFYEGQEHSFFNARNAGGKYFRLTLAAADEFLVSLGWLPPAPDLPPNSESNPPTK